MRTHFVRILLACMILLGCCLKDVAASDQIYALTIMHTNDSHGHLQNQPRLFTAVKSVRAKHGNSILVDAGDVFTGTVYFTKYLGLADMEFMNRLRYDAATFGNHEFDVNSEVLAKFVAYAQFPFVSANINFSNDPFLSRLKRDKIGNPPQKGKIYPAIIKKIRGEQIGIFGLTTEATSYLANPGEDVVFEQAIPAAVKTVSALKDNGINKIIVLSHLGFSADEQLAESVAGIDLIVGSHSHTKLEEPVVITANKEPVVIVQAGANNNYLGRVDLEFDRAGVITGWKGKLLDLFAKDEKGNELYPENEWAKRRLAELTEPLEGGGEEIIGFTEVNLNGNRQALRTGETNLGNLITDAMLAEVRKFTQAELALQNSGEIRSSIAAGEINRDEVMSVLPFNSTLVSVQLLGEEIIQILEHGVANVEEEAGKFLQVSGLRYRFDQQLPAGERIISAEILRGESYDKLNPETLYTVAINSYIAKGGDGFAMLENAAEQGRGTNHHVLISDVLIRYLKGNSPVSPNVEGRIISL